MVLLEEIHAAVEAGQGLSPSQAKQLYDSHHSLMEALRFTFRSQERPGRVAAEARRAFGQGDDLRALKLLGGASR